MNKVVKILMERDGMSEEEARSLIKETVDEIISNPEDTDSIIEEYLGLEPDYLDYIVNF